MRALKLSLPLLVCGCVAETFPLGPTALPGSDIDQIEGALSGLRWELPCQEHVYPEVCLVQQDAEVRARMAGAPGARYAARVRLRGVVEPTSYPGGDPIAPSIVRGGTHQPEDPWNVYVLQIDRPLAVYHLNAGTSGRYDCVQIDATLDLHLDAGAEVRLIARSIDGRQITNRDAQGEPILIEDVPPYPSAYDGQFIQMDVEAIARVR